MTSAWLGRVGGALAGASFFVWIAGTRVLDPGEIGWLMRFDWPVHFFGWHFFRREPWHWPPGLISTYYAPIGTAIGFTDSIPLVALLLKPVQAWLPATFQYLGAWLLSCFVLQGAFGAWLVSRVTPRTSLQVCGAALFVLTPALLIRLGHPALCSHWLLLWALVIATRDGAPRARWPEWAALGGIAGLIHPYLAVMTLGLLGAVALTPGRAPLAARGLAIVAAGLATLGGWWAAGLFSVSGAESLSTEGLGHYSMNLLGPVTPAGWSRLLPDLPSATAGQAFEGFQYQGVGVLALLVLGAVVAVRGRAVPDGRPAPAASSPGHRGPGFGGWVVATALAMAVAALSPRVTLGADVLVDLDGPWLGPLAVFRATGRFFWPLAYVLLAWALATVCTRLAPRTALAVLVAAVGLQAVDLHGAHASRRASARDPAFHAWDSPMPSPVWHQVLRHYDHVVLYPPPQCGAAPVGFEAPAYLAGLHGLTLNTGGVARPDDAARLRYCHDLGERVKAGQLDDRSLYLVAPDGMDAIRAAAPAVCGGVDRVAICVTERSATPWRSLVELR